MRPGLTGDGQQKNWYDRSAPSILGRWRDLISTVSTTEFIRLRLAPWRYPRFLEPLPRRQGPCLRVQTGSGTVDVLKLQRPGGKVLDTKTFLNGHAITPGSVFTLPKDLHANG